MPPPEFGHNSVSQPAFFRKNHCLNLNILDVNPVYSHSCNNCENDGIQNGGNVIHKQAECIYTDADYYSDSAYLEIRMGLSQAHSKKILSALRTAGSENHSCSNSGTKASEKCSQHSVFY